MICPHCHQDIPDAELARHLASRGGKSRSPAKLQAVRANAALAREARARKRNSVKSDNQEKTMQPQCHCCTSEFQWYADHIDPSGLAETDEPDSVIRDIWIALGLNQNERRDRYGEYWYAIPLEEFVAGYRRYAEKLASEKK